MTQAQVGVAAGVSRETVSRVERGEVSGISLGTLTALTRALEIRLDIGLRWRGESLDRLLDAAHAALVEQTVCLLDSLGWETAVEVTFSRYGERGSVDVLAWFPKSAAMLVVEVKSVVPDLQAMLAGIDRKARIAPHLVEGRGWRSPRCVGRLLVLRRGRTIERRMAMHRALLAAALPDRGGKVAAWLRDPRAGGLAGILILPDSRGATTRRPDGPNPAARRPVPPPDSRVA